MKIKRRSGFTMVEILVVFMVMTVLTGVSVPPIQAYYQNTSYKDVQNRAETVFYAAQQTVTSMALSSQIEQFFHRVETDAFPVDDILFPYFGLEDDSALSNRYYAMRYKRSDLSNPNASNEGKLVLELLQNLVTEKDIFNASITIEVDSHTRTIQTVFYSLEDTTFTYVLGVGEGILLTSENRSDERLKQLNLGMAEANVSVKVLALETNVLQEPFIASDIDLVNPPSGFVDDGNDDDGDDDPPGDGGDPWVITDPTFPFTNPFNINLKLSKLTHVESLRINWMSSIDSKPITYTYRIWYYHQGNGTWKSYTNTNKTLSNTGDLELKTNGQKWTTELRIEILSNGNTDSKSGIFEFTVYTKVRSEVFSVPITVTFTNRN